MDVEVNYLAVLLAAVSSKVVGSIWYAKSVFGKTWAQMAGVDMDRKPKQGEMAWLLGSTFVVSLITAYILAHVTYLAHSFFIDNSFLSDALQTAFWLWLGLTAARMYTHNAFEGRRKKLILPNISNELVTLLVMAMIIGLLKP
jgi:hypothetical protein